MIFDTNNMTVQVNRETALPLPMILDGWLYWQTLQRAREVFVGGCDTMEMNRIDGTRYSFLWNTDDMYVKWIPRAAHPPTEQTIERLRIIPGYLLGDLIRAFGDSESHIESNPEFIELDHERFGYVQIG